MVNISYDEQRVDLNILRRSQHKQQRHSSGLKSSLKLPLSYQVKLQPKNKLCKESHLKEFEMNKLVKKDRTNFEICSASLPTRIEAHWQSWLCKSVVGGVRGARPPAADPLLCFPLLWNHCRSFCDHAGVLYMVIGLLIFTLMCLIKKFKKTLPDEIHY